MGGCPPTNHENSIFGAKRHATVRGESFGLAPDRPFGFAQDRPVEP
jgi:hypothetical protein